MTWQPWYSYALLIFAACVGFLAIEWKHSPVITEEESFKKKVDASPPLWVDILTALIFFGMLLLALVVL